MTLIRSLHRLNPPLGSEHGPVELEEAPTKAEAVVLCLLAVSLLASNLFGVLAEGNRAAVGYWISQALNIGLLLFGLWWYRTAWKKPPKQP